MRNLFLFLLCVGLCQVMIAQNIIRGKILKESDSTALAFVNVGIVNRNIGTVSNQNGEFRMVIDSTVSEKDSLKFSMIGFTSLAYTVSDIRKRLSNEEGNLNLRMKEHVTSLLEVVVTDRKFKSKILGNETTSKFFSGGFGSKDLGSEIGIRLNIKKKDTFIKDFNFFISYNRFDSLTFRVNIYDFKDGKPYRNLMTENVVLKLGKNTGKITVDLSKYDIVVSDDVLISLEWLEKVGGLDAGLYISAAVLNSPTYLRKASQGRWEIKKGIGLGINATVQY